MRRVFFRDRCFAMLWAAGVTSVGSVLKVRCCALARRLQAAGFSGAGVWDRKAGLTLRKLELPQRGIKVGTVERQAGTS